MTMMMAETIKTPPNPHYMSNIKSQAKLLAEYRKHAFLMIGALLIVGGMTVLVLAYTW